MKILLCVHGYPDEFVGGTERSAQFLAQGFGQAGHEVVVFCGSATGALEGQVAVREELHEVEGASHALKVLRVTRPDLYFDHWHKSQSARVATRFREVLEREKPDLVHVLHWIRLTRDLVLLAAQAGVPAVVSLNDSFLSCPLVFRVESAGGTACERSLSAMHCLSCAGRVAPRTPWVDMEGGFLKLGERTRDLLRELHMARAVIVPTEGFAKRQEALMGETIEANWKVLAPRGSHSSRPERRPSRTAGEVLRLGMWCRHSTLKGTDLLFDAVESLGVPSGVELVLAGAEDPKAFIQRLGHKHPRVRWRFEMGFTPEGLDRHPVSRVHAMVSASRAPESYGLVLDEARALGLPTILPEAGAFAERSSPEQGTLFFEGGDASSLAAAIGRLRDEEGLHETLVGCVPEPVQAREVLSQHLEVYETAISAGAPSEVPEVNWFDARMQNFAEEQWDQSLSACSAEELGFHSTPNG